MYIFINSDQNISCLVLSLAIKGMNEKLNENYEDYGNSKSSSPWVITSLGYQVWPNF